MKKKTESGFIALTSVLIIGAVVLVLGVSLFHSSLTDYSISSAYENGQEAAFLADFCLKEGILRLKENIDYMGGEDIEVNNKTCYISLVEDIHDNTKKVYSLGKAGDQPHLSRSSQLICYVIEPSEDGWVEGEELKDLEIVGGSLKIKYFEEKFILNSATGESCDALCQQENSYQCISIGTDPAASDGKRRTAFLENEEYSCIEEGASCGDIMLDHSQELADCYGYAPAWTYCKCEHEEIGGYRISPEFDISGLYTVKDSQIFWQADERFDGTIKTITVEVRIFDGIQWGGWQQVSNGAGIPGLEPGTSLLESKVQTKISFVGDPDYPSLKNIKIFIEIE